MILHAALFFLVTLLSSWTYHALRRESVSSALRDGTKRALVLTASAALVAAVLQWWTSGL